MCQMVNEGEARQGKVRRFTVGVATKDESLQISCIQLTKYSILTCTLEVSWRNYKNKVSWNDIYWSTKTTPVFFLCVPSSPSWFSPPTHASKLWIHWCFAQVVILCVNKVASVKLRFQLLAASKIQSAESNLYTGRPLDSDEKQKHFWTSYLPRGVSPRQFGN